MPTLSTAEASQRLGINVKTLYKLIDSGKIGYIRYGIGRIRLTELQIEEFLRRSTVEATAYGKKAA